MALPAPCPASIRPTRKDLARGKPTEIDHLNGYVVKRGAALGVPTPLNHALQVLVKLAEMKRYRLSYGSGQARAASSSNRSLRPAPPAPCGAVLRSRASPGF